MKWLPNLAQGLVKIGDNVLRVLDPDGDADHVGGDAGAELLLGSHLGVRAGGRMQHAGAGIADVNDERGDLEVFDEGSGRLDVAFYAKGQNTAAGIFQEILADAGTVGIAFEAGINDPVDAAMMFEKLGQG